MFRILTLAALLSMAASAAYALDISNLDDVPHRVVVEPVPGSKVIRLIDPGATIHSIDHAGEVYIEGNPQHIRITPGDTLVIWGDGNLQIQMRKKIRRQVF